MCSKIFKTKAELFHLIKKFWNKTKTFWFVPEFLKNKSRTFPFNLKILEQNQNVLICSRIFKTVFSTGSLTTSTGTFLASATLSRPQLTFLGTSSSLSRPLKHLKASIDTLTASTDTLTASKALSRPLQSTSTQSWLVIGNSQVLSHGCESLVEAVRVLLRPWECCILQQPLWAPLQSLMGTLKAFISTLMASTGIFLNSTTLTRPKLILTVPCKHSHSSATVS